MLRLTMRLPLPFLLAACAPSGDSARAGSLRDTVVVYEAASLSAPMKPALDSFSRRTGAVVMEEHGASLELARRLTELHRIPDLIALADQEVFPELLRPSHTAWFARFARNRMVIAYTPRSRAAAEIGPANWYHVLQRPEVLVARTDPALAPAGYRALLMYGLAETYYHQPGLMTRLSARTPDGLIRGNAADLAALLEAGEVDYIVDYESLARAHRFRWVTLPPEIDLGDPARAEAYGQTVMRWGRGRDSVRHVAAPIVYALSVPRHAPHASAGARLAAFLLGAEGRRILREANVDALDVPELVGDSVPAVVRAAVRP
jgi:molybdate/tungstate transport system substrate-binding protein